MIYFCANTECGRAFADVKPERKGVTPPTLCPACRAPIRKPLDCRVGGKLPGEPPASLRPAPPALEDGR